MAGKAKSVHLTVNPKGQFQSVFRKTFFDAKGYNEQAYSLITEVINGRAEYDDVSAELQDVANTVADIADEIEGIEHE